MSVTTTVESAIAFAEEVLASETSKPCKVAHNFNYLSKRERGKASSDDSAPSRVIYTNPGKARLVELKLPPEDARAGMFPQHNSPGSFPESFEIIPALTLNDYQKIHTYDALIEKGFEPDTAVLTKKRISLIAKQFANLSPICFREMICLNQDENCRDFQVMVKRSKLEGSLSNITIAFINPKLEFVQFFQNITRNEQGKIVDIRHIVCEMGAPLVINHSCVDSYGRLRNIANVGTTGSVANAYKNSLERFDDGTIVWTSSDFKYGRQKTGSAALREDGAVFILPGSDRVLGEYSARNLGAESIDEQTQSWTGKYSDLACIPEKDDKYIMRREYKNAVRNKVNQIIDGACIPGPEPIFNVS